MIIVFYFGCLCSTSRRCKVAIILLFSLVGIAGQLRRRLVRHPRQHLRQLPHRLRQPRGQALPRLRDPAQGGHEHRHAADQRRAVHHALHPALHPARLRGPCFIGFAIGESLGAAALRIAGGIFTKIADIGSDLMKIVFKIKEDDARNPGVIADCTGDNAGDSVGPTADGFETYGVTGVALITFILLAVPKDAGAGAAAGLDLRDAHHDDRGQRRLLLRQRGLRQGPVRHRGQDELRGAAHHPGLGHLDRLGGADLRRLLAHDPRSAATASLWWKLSTVITCGTLAGAIIPELVKVFTSTELGPRARGRHLLARGRGLAQHPLRPGGGQLQRLLAGPRPWCS